MPQGELINATRVASREFAERIQTRLSQDLHPFSYRTIRRKIGVQPGLYSFWLGRGCLYVGMSSTSVRSRLLQHYESNKKLRKYFRAYPEDIYCSHALLPDVTLVRSVEPLLIVSMNPKTNIHYKRR